MQARCAHKDAQPGQGLDGLDLEQVTVGPDLLAPAVVTVATVCPGRGGAAPPLYGEGFLTIS